MKDQLTLIIPTHNEETVVTRALSTLESQELGDVQLKVIVVPNGCVDKTLSVVKEFISGSKNKNITWQVEELKDGHRTKALNHGVLLSATDIVMYLNPDCLLQPTAVVYMFNLLKTNVSLNYVGMLEEPDLSFLVPGTMLYKAVQLFWCNRKVAGTHPPSGRFIAFRKAIFSKFPEIHSEDTWASIYSYKEYGPKSIMVVKEQTVKYIPYSNWVDFMRVESRYLEGTLEVFNKFPGFKEIDMKRAEEGKVPDDERHRLIAEFCKENGIEQDFVYKLKDVIFPLVRENILLVHQISDTGTWELVK